MNNLTRIVLLFAISLFLISTLSAQTSCPPEINFPGGRVIMSFDGNVHDDDDIVALPYSVGLWWAAGLKDRVVQVEYNNHVCGFSASETDGTGPGAGDDSQNMVNSVNGAISRFGYNPNIFYNYEQQGGVSTAKMAAEIERSSSSNPLWIIAAGPMETVYRALERANTGFANVTIISHSAWNEAHEHCSNTSNWADMKSKYQPRGVFFVGNCISGSNSCNQSSGLDDQNGNFSSAISNWHWMNSSSREYNRWIFSRNPFSNKFDPSDAGMSYYLITGGPFLGGKKNAGPSDARKIMENPCTDADDASIPENSAPSISIISPLDQEEFQVGSTITIRISASDNDGSIVKHQVFRNGTVVDTDGANYTPYELKATASGIYTIRVDVTDNQGLTASATSEITVGNIEEEQTEEQEQTENFNVSFSSPQDNQNFNAGSNVVVNVASTNGQTVSRHQIFVNGHLVDTDGSVFTPHRINSISNGTYEIRAVVTYTSGEKAENSVTITVGTENNDEVAEDDDQDQDVIEETSTSDGLFLSPQNGQVFSSGAGVKIDLNTSGLANVSKHQIFVNGVLIDTDLTNFTPAFINNAKQGSYVVKARITYNNGQIMEQEIRFIVSSTTVQEEDASDIRIVPNPVTDGRTLVFHQGSTFYRIMNMTGAQVAVGSLSGDNVAQISVSGLPKGIYILVLSHGSKQFIID